MQKDELKGVQVGEDKISFRISDSDMTICQSDSKKCLDDAKKSDILAVESQGLNNNFLLKCEKVIIRKILTHKFKGGLTYLHHQAMEKNACFVKKLIDLGADVNAEDDCQRRPLHYACTVEVAELLISNGAEINSKDEKGKTALYLAYIDNNILLVKFLLEKGADFLYFKQHRRLPSDMTETQLLHSMMYEDGEI